jgi:hypothetical protein
MDGVQTRLDGAIDKGYISKILRLALLAPALSTLSSQGERIRGCSWSGRCRRTGRSSGGAYNDRCG